MANLYESSAKLYDADNRDILLADIPFYLQRAKNLSGKVLELACGTGRITIPLAENGTEIWGLDYSNAMLNKNETLDFESIMDNGDRVTRHSIKKSIDLDKRLLFIDFIYRLYKTDGQIEEVHENIRLRYFYEQHIKALITDAGFIIDEQYGWYDGTPSDEGSEFIFVCSKA